MLMQLKNPSPQRESNPRPTGRGFDSRWKLDKRKKKDRTFQQSILLQLLNKKKRT